MAIPDTLGPIIWQADLASSTATTAWPSGTSQGISLPSATASPGRVGARLHVLLMYQVAAGTVSTDVHLYGYHAQSGIASWAFLGSLNGGNSITARTDKWSPTTSTVVLAEYFAVGLEQFSRYATRCINPQGTTPLVSTWIGYEGA